jgi:hypothetical protein
MYTIREEREITPVTLPTSFLPLLRALVRAVFYRAGRGNAVDDAHAECYRGGRNVGSGRRR